MGQKVHPTGLRLGVIRTWESRWYAEKDYANLLHEDVRIRKFLKRKLYHAGIAKIEIERAANKLKIGIWTARPGIVIGKKGAEIENLKRELTQYTSKEVFINIQEVRKAEVNAQLVAENVATQLERRIAFRRAMKKAVTSAMKLGAKGIRIHSAGRLGGSEMSRKEWYREGRVPLHTLRADIDYGFAEASTTYGKIGVKVWIFHGEILPEAKGRAEAREAAREGRGRQAQPRPAGD
jgi:small subunit ribosomal protein S3